MHAPWALAINARLRERYGVDGQAVASDDGIVIRIPDTDAEPPGGDVIVFEPDEIEALVTQEVGGSALFASRFRECAARALLLPRRDPGRRSPLWQQRQRSAALLEVASRYPSFPIVLEAVRECLQDVYDLPALVALMRGVERREVQVVDVATHQPSPFARSLLFGYVAQFMYEGDSPIAERRAAALALDQGLLAELLGRAELRELLDPEVLAEVEAELQRLAPDRRARDAEGVADLLRLLGPLTHGRGGRARRRLRRHRGAHLARARTPRSSRCGWPAPSAGRRSRTSAGCATGWASRSRPAPPTSSPTRSTTRSADLVARFARTHGPFTTDDVADRLGLGAAVVRHTLQRLAAQGRVLDGEFRPSGSGHGVVRRRGAAPAPSPLAGQAAPGDRTGRARDRSGRFLSAWQHVSTGSGGLRGVDGVLSAIDQLAGCAVPASALEPLVLGARVRDYEPSYLDELTASGEVIWAGHAALPGSDGWVSLHLADQAPLTLPDHAAFEHSELHQAVLDALAPGGAWFFRQLSDSVALHRRRGALGRPLGPGLGGPDQQRHPHPAAGADPRRHPRPPQPAAAAAEQPAGAAGPHRARPRPPAAGRCCPRSTPTRPDAPTRPPSGCSTGTAWSPAVRSSASGCPAASPRSTRCSPPSRTPAAAAAATSSPASAPRSSAPPARSTGCAPSARCATDAKPVAVALAATDPANPYGAALPWPQSADGGHRPGRKAGAIVVLVDGVLTLYVERGGRTLLTWTDDADLLDPGRRLRWPTPSGAGRSAGSPSRRPTASSCSDPARPRCARRSRRPASSPPRRGCG